MHKNIKSLLPLMAAMTLAGTSVSHAIIVEEQFLTGSDPSAGEYTVAPASGQTPTVTGFTGTWDVNSGGSPVIQSAGLSYSNASGTVASSGGSLAMTNNNSRAGRLLSSGLDSSSTGTYYLSFMYQQASTNAGYRGIDFFNGSASSSDRVIALTADNSTANQLNINAFGTSQTNISTIGTDVVFFVMKFEMSDTADSDTFSLYINPDLSTEPGSVAYSASGLNISLNRVGLERWASGASSSTIWLDEIRMAQNYNEVTTVSVPEPRTTALIAGLCVMLGAMAYRRRKA